MAESSPFAQIVTVGSSNLETLLSFVATLPTDLAAPIIISHPVTTLRADHGMDQIRQRSMLPVQVVHTETQLAEGTIYVVPNNRVVRFTRHRLSLVETSNDDAAPSIQFLFDAAAEAFSDLLIAIILSGVGHESATSALNVKRHGGTVILQKPHAPTSSTVPRSLTPTSVDFIVDLAEIGRVVQDLLNGTQQLEGSSDTKPLQAFLSHLRERSGLDFTTYKPATIQRRIRRRLVATGSPTLAAYQRYLQHQPDEYARLISALLIKVTEFFRDPELFDELRTRILPTLISAARHRSNELRLWSAGCATGEEAYSLAILLAELLGEELNQFDIRIFATDLDSDAISFARRGIYSAGAVAGMPPEWLKRYFQRTDSEYEVHKQIRNLVIFGLHDLGQRAPFPRIDLVLCRNVLIYFTVELQKRVLQLFAYSLRDGGYLMLGKAETTSPLAEFFAIVQPALKIYRRQGERLMIPLGQLKDVAPLRAALTLPGRSNASSLHVVPPKEPPRLRTSLEKLGSLVFNLPIGVVVVDRRYDVQVINSLAHTLLGINRPVLGEDLLHFADGVPTKTLRAIIDAALRRDAPLMTIQVVPTENETSTPRYLQIAAYPQQIEGETGPTLNVLLLITDVTGILQEQLEAAEGSSMSQTMTLAPLPPPSAVMLPQQEEETLSMTTQMQRLLDVNRELREANQELTATNIELHQANEEYLVNTEEVQAAAEEVETLNEELQATNEELETLNEELQATVEELNATNDDLEARSTELHEMVLQREEQHRKSEAERAQLEAILISMAEAVLVLDAHEVPVRTNAAYLRMFGDPKRPFMALDEEGKPLSLKHTLQHRTARGETYQSAFTLADSHGMLRRYEAQSYPLTTGDAGMLVIRDITERDTH